MRISCVVMHINNYILFTVLAIVDYIPILWICVTVLKWRMRHRHLIKFWRKRKERKNSGVILTSLTGRGWSRDWKRDWNVKKMAIQPRFRWRDPQCPVSLSMTAGQYFAQSRFRFRDPPWPRYLIKNGPFHEATTAFWMLILSNGGKAFN